MSKMEQSFQTDLSDVGIHENSERADQLGIKAFAQGNEIHFGSGNFNTDTQEGQELIGS